MTDPFSDSIARRIISARMRRGIRQGELARQIGISKNAMSKIETGDTRHPRADVIQKIAQALRVSADYLLMLSDENDLEAATLASVEG